MYKLLYFIYQVHILYQEALSVLIICIALISVEMKREIGKHFYRNSQSHISTSQINETRLGHWYIGTITSSHRSNNNLLKGWSYLVS